MGIEVGEAALVTEIARGAEEWEQATAGLTEGDDALAKMTEALPGTIERAQQLEARPDLISQMKQTLGRVRGWVAAARSVLEPPSAKKAANTATTAAARADLVEGLRLQAARLPLPPTLSGQLSSAIERDQKWRGDARKLLRAGAAEPRASLQKLVDAPGAHPSAELEQLSSPSRAATCSPSSRPPPALAGAAAAAMAAAAAAAA